MMNVLLAVSLAGLIPPCTPVGVGGLVVWLIMTITFAGGEEVAKEIQTGGKGCGVAWLAMVFILVILGGAVALSVLTVIANAGRL